MTQLPTNSRMWLSSSEHPAWDRPRQVRFQRLLQGPDDRRHYAMFCVDSDSLPEGPTNSSTSIFVATPRFGREFTDPLLHRPIHVHVWLVADERSLEDDRFEPMKPNADAWCTLYAQQQEALDKQAQPW